MARESLYLPHHQVIELRPAAPFNFDATLHKPDHFPSADNHWEPGVRWQTMLWAGTPLGLKFANRGTVDQPAVSLTVWSAAPLDADFVSSLCAEINHRYNLGLNLAEFTERLQADPQLSAMLDKWRGMRPLNHSSLYEYLIIAIVLQNTIVRRSVQMLQALFEHYGTRLCYDDRELSCFWEPQVIDRATEQDLRDLKLGYRAKSVKRVTAAFVNREIDEFDLRRKTREEQRTALLGLYGIGPASVGYLLSDVFHHLDELNYIPPWEQKIYSKLFCATDTEEPAPVDQLLRLFDERFGSYKALAVHYVWEDLFWRRQHEHIAWLEQLIRL